jgi:hypothetical protein
MKNVTRSYVSEGVACSLVRDGRAKSGEEHARQEKKTRKDLGTLEGDKKWDMDKKTGLLD